MAVVVFDADVLIGFLNASDAHHAEALTMMRGALAAGTRRLLSAVNYGEIMVGPIKAGKAAREHVDAMLGHFSFEIVTVDRSLAERAAAVRARTGIKLPDAYALATAIHAEHRGYDDVRVASFDAAVLNAHAALHPAR